MNYNTYPTQPTNGEVDINVANLHLGNGEIPKEDATATLGTTALARESSVVEPKHEQILPAGNVARQYSQTIDELAAAHDKIGREMGLIDERLNLLYARKPHLKPANMLVMQASDEAFVRYKSGTTKLADGRNDRTNLAVKIAAASRRNSDGTVGATYRNLVEDGSRRSQAAQHVLDNLAFFAHNGVGVDRLGQAELQQFGLGRTDIQNYQWAASNDPDNSWDVLPSIETPPLHLKQLAADIINHNGDSVMPTGTLARITRAPSHTISHTRISNAVQQVKHAAGSYLSQRYNVPRPQGRILGVLAECDLIEQMEQNGLITSRDHYSAVINRVRPIFSKVNRDDVPEGARDVFDRYSSLSVPRGR